MSPAPGRHKLDPDHGAAPPAARSWSRCIPSDPARLRRIRLGIEQFIREAGFDDKAADDIGLCVNEALANIMRYAYHGRRDQPILIDAECDSQSLRLYVRDWGDPFDPAAAMQRGYNPLEPGGVGLLCLKRLMDEVKYHPQQRGTLLTMTRSRNRNPHHETA